MKAAIETVLDRFAAGKLSRRDAVAALVSLAPAPPASAAAPLTARNINHVTLSVSDIAASRAFYQKLLGAKVIGESSFECDLALGTSFIALMKLNRQPGVDHFCIGVDGYDAVRAANSIDAVGVKTRRLDSIQGVRFKEGQIYVDDPDGIKVQFARPDYAGEMKR